MDQAKAFFLAHWKKLVPVIALALGAFVGVKFSVKDGAPGTQPEIVIVLPSDGETDGPPLAMAPAAGGVFNRDFYPIARVYAARQYAAEKGTTFATAFAKVRKVKDSDIASAAFQAGIQTQAIGDGSVIKWFTEHQDQIFAMVKIILSFMAAFG